MIEEPQFRNRFASVLATLEARERQRKRAIVGGLLLLMTIVAVSVTAIAYFSLVGDQHHMLEIQIGEATYRIESHTGPFTIEVPGKAIDLPIAAGNGGFLSEHLRLKQVVPRSYLWAPMADTSQVVKLSQRETECLFQVNGIPFHADANRLRTEGLASLNARQWEAEARRTVVIDIDYLLRASRPH